MLFLLTITSSYFSWLNFGATSAILMIVSFSAYFQVETESSPNAYSHDEDRQNSYNFKYNKYYNFYNTHENRGDYSYSRKEQTYENSYNNSYSKYNNPHNRHENYNNYSYDKKEQAYEKKTGFDSDDPYEVLG